MYIVCNIIICILHVTCLIIICNMHITRSMYTIRFCISHFQSFRNEVSNFSKDNLKSTLFSDDVIYKKPQL